MSIIIFESYCFTFNLPKWVLSTQNNFYCTVLAPTHYLFQGLVINIAVSSTYPRLLEGLNFKEQTMTVHKMYVENNAPT